jgi:hypothetical protein
MSVEPSECPRVGGGLGVAFVRSLHGYANAHTALMGGRPSTLNRQRAGAAKENRLVLNNPVLLLRTLTGASSDRKTAAPHGRPLASISRTSSNVG